MNYLKNKENTALDGSRIINLEQLSSLNNDISCHKQTCKYGIVSLLGETFWIGLAVASVWGQMATGGGQTCLTETMSVLGVSVMANKIIHGSRSWYPQVLVAIIRKVNERSCRGGKGNSNKEKFISSFHEGIPATGVLNKLEVLTLLWENRESACVWWIILRQLAWTLL